MFKYDNKADTVSYDIKYVFSSKTENKGKDEDIFPIPNAAIIAFESERYIITNYLANQMIGTCIYDKKNEVVNSGLVSTETLYPFTPMVLKENILYGVYDRHLVFDDKNDYIIVKYELKK